MIPVYNYEAMNLRGRMEAGQLRGDTPDKASESLRKILGVFVTSLCDPSDPEVKIMEEKPNRCQYAICFFRRWCYRFLDNNAPLVIGLCGLFVFALSLVCLQFVFSESAEYKHDLHASWQRVHGKTIDFEDWQRLRNSHLLPGQAAKADDTIIVMPINTGSR